MTNDIDQTRRDLIALREAHGADTPVGHRCSNIVELLQAAQTATGEQLEAIKANIQRQMADLAAFRNAAQ